jgi:hypothetical protein
MRMMEKIDNKMQATVNGTPGIDEGTQFDPYLYGVEMPFSAFYCPLGFPLRIATNSLEVLAAAQASWERYEPRMVMDPIRLQIGVRTEDSMECPAMITPRAHQHLMTGIADAGNFFIADLMRDVSFAWVTTAAMGHPWYLRNQILEPAVLSHIANRYSAPVHAACVAHEGRGVLLCGESGAGKSSLAFACARAGWTYVSDDAAFLVHGRHDREVIGHCHSIRLRPATAELFAELRGWPLTPRARGKPTIQVEISQLPGVRSATHCRADFAVFLNRSEWNAQELTPFPREAARSFLHRHLNGWEPLRKDQIASVDRLLSVKVYELRYRELDWAINRLEQMVREES